MSAPAVRSEGGFTIVEVMMAALILAIAATATFQILSATARTNHRNEQAQVAISRAEAELEKLRVLKFDQLALTSSPATSTDPSNPGHRVTASCPNIGIANRGCFALNSSGTNPAPLVVQGGGVEKGSTTVTTAAVSPGPTAFTDGDVSGKIYRYITWQNDPACPATQCPGFQDFKRIVVIVTLNQTFAGQLTYREIQSSAIDPEAGRDVEPSPTVPSNVVAQELWMTDTTCDHTDRTGFGDHGDHVVHNTLGDCPAGKQTGATAGAPDLLIPEAPDLNPCCADNNQPQYDFATDVEPVADTGADRGIQLREGTVDGCEYTPQGTVPQERTHRWLSNPMASNFTFIMQANATLELWTRTLGNAVSSGRICAFLFIRDHNPDGQAVDTMISNRTTGYDFWNYSANPWPASGWDRAIIPMSLKAPDNTSVVHVYPGQRIGLAITVDRAGTGTADALQFLYDHTDFDSHLEIQTTTPLPPG